MTMMRQTCWICHNKLHFQLRWRMGTKIWLFWPSDLNGSWAPPNNPPRSFQVYCMLFPLMAWSSAVVPYFKSYATNRNFDCLANFGWLLALVMQCEGINMGYWQKGTSISLPFMCTCGLKLKNDVNLYIWLKGYIFSKQRE